MAATAAHKARAVRREALRDYLSARGLLDHVIDLAKKIEELSPESVIEQIQAAIQENPDVDVKYIIAAHEQKLEFDLKKYKAAADIKLKLVNKYLGDEKSVDTNLTIDDRRSADDYTDAELLALIKEGDSGTGDGPEAGASKLH